MYILGTDVTFSKGNMGWNDYFIMIVFTIIWWGLTERI